MLKLETAPAEYQIFWSNYKHSERCDVSIHDTQKQRSNHPMNPPIFPCIPTLTPNNLLPPAQNLLFFKTASNPMKNINNPFK